MTRRTWMVALVVVALLVVAFGARAMAEDSDDGGAGRSISVTSTATVGTEPDQATLRLGIETSPTTAPMRSLGTGRSPRMCSPR